MKAFFRFPGSLCGSCKSLFSSSVVPHYVALTVLLFVTHTSASPSPTLRHLQPRPSSDVGSPLTPQWPVLFGPAEVHRLVGDILRASEELRQVGKDREVAEKREVQSSTDEAVQGPTDDAEATIPVSAVTEATADPAVGSLLQETQTSLQEAADIQAVFDTAEFGTIENESHASSELDMSPQSDRAGLSGVVMSGVTQKHVEGVTIDDLTVKDLMRSVLRIHVTRVIPDFGMPWTNKGEASATGSGFPIAGRRIITNAHVTTYGHIIRIEKPGSPSLFDARVVSVAHEPDLAVLTVDDDRFWAELSPLEFIENLDSEEHSTIPKLLGGVFVVGYPTGGKSLSVTQGIVSRVEVGRYSHSAAHLLQIQIDAAINPGNSGGPVVNPDGKVVGVAFQGLTQASNIGYIIPVTIVKHLLNDIDLHGKYTGMVSLGVAVQSLRNPILREYVGLLDLSDEDMLAIGHPDGVLVTDVDALRVERFQQQMPSVENLGLQEGDVLLSLDGHDVAEDGSIHFRNVERVAMSYLLTGKYEGDLIPAKVLRNKSLTEVQIPLSVPEYLVPPHTNDVKPRYIVFGGCIFVALTKQYILDYEQGRNRLGLSTKISGYQGQFKTEDLEEIVILSRILSSKWTKGYYVQNRVLATVNGNKVRSLSHLAELLDLVDTPQVAVRSDLSPLELQAAQLDDPQVHQETALVPVEGEQQLTTGDDPVKLLEGDQESEDRYLKFGFAGDKYYFVLDRAAALQYNPLLLKFHRIALPMYLGDETSVAVQ